MSNYQFVKLNQLCTKITDGSHYSPTGVGDGIPMLSVKDMLDNKFSYADCKFISEQDYLDLVKSDCKPLLNDVLIAKDGSYLKHVFVVKEEMHQAVLSSIGILRPNLKKVIPEYLKYYLQTKSVRETVAKKYVSGSALPRIILKNFGEIDIIQNDLPTQKKIAAVLSSLDAKIELNNRINAELEAMAKTLYDYWFVQFDFPDENGKPYKSGGGKMVWNEQLKREVPEGWEVKRLDDFADTASGGTPRSTRAEFYEGGVIPWINSGELNNPYLIKAKNAITEQGLINSSAKMFKEDILLIAMYGATAGRVSLLKLPACTNQAICAVIPKSKIYTNFLKFALSDLYGYMVSLSTGSARDNLSQDMIKELNILLAQNDLLIEFNLIVDDVIKKICLNLKENQTLSSLRDWLLPMLMNGQVRVK